MANARPGGGTEGAAGEAAALGGEQRAPPGRRIPGAVGRVPSCRSGLWKGRSHIFEGEAAALGHEQRPPLGSRFLEAVGPHCCKYAAKIFPASCCSAASAISPEPSGQRGMVWPVHQFHDVRIQGCRYLASWDAAAAAAGASSIAINRLVLASHIIIHSQLDPARILRNVALIEKSFADAGMEFHVHRAPTLALGSPAGLAERLPELLASLQGWLDADAAAALVRFSKLNILTVHRKSAAGAAGRAAGLAGRRCCCLGMPLLHLRRTLRLLLRDTYKVLHGLIHLSAAEGPQCALFRLSIAAVAMTDAVPIFYEKVKAAPGLLSAHPTDLGSVLSICCCWSFAAC